MCLYVGGIRGGLQGTSDAQKGVLAARARGGGAFGKDPSMMVSTTFVAEVLAGGLFLPLLFILAPILSRAASSNLLVPRMSAANDGVGPRESG